MIVPVAGPAGLGAVVFAVIAGLMVYFMRWIQAALSYNLEGRH